MLIKNSIGTRIEVMNNIAKKTSGGLTKKDLKYKNGQIISKKASNSAIKRYKMNDGLINSRLDFKPLNTTNKTLNMRTNNLGTTNSNLRTTNSNLRTTNNNLRTTQIEIEINNNSRITTTATIKFPDIIIDVSNINVFDKKTISKLRKLYVNNIKRKIKIPLVDIDRSMNGLINTIINSLSSYQGYVYKYRYNKNDIKITIYVTKGLHNYITNIKNKIISQ